jgi:hypothetical protein
MRVDFATSGMRVDFATSEGPNNEIFYLAQIDDNDDETSS